MGSLMAGWDAPVQDPKTVKLDRNRSLTNEGIETYWRSKKKTEEELMLASPKLSHQDQENRGGEESEKKYMRSISFPLASSSNTKENLVETHEERMEKLLKKSGWWISSNWAFLNEPPVISSEAPTYKYASQYHVPTRTGPTTTTTPTPTLISPANK